MNNLTLVDMLLQGWPVLSILLVMSIFSTTIIVDRVLAIRRARTNARAFVARVVRIMSAEGVAPAVEFCAKHNKPVAAVAAEMLMQPGKRAARERAVQHAMQGQVRRLETMVPVLGTVASTAPFVGLFGTVSGSSRPLPASRPIRAEALRWWRRASPKR